MGASVTFWEATAPVKLPACHGPDTGSRCRLEIKSSKAGIPPATPPNLAARLRSLPAILYMLDPIPVASYSKAPRGLSVLPRVTCIFTGTSVSPSAWPRQRPTRYAIRAGRNLPDKEFRSLSYPPSVSGRRRIQRLPACRHADGTISSPKHWVSGVWPLRILISSVPWFLPVHRAHDLHDGGEPLTRQMLSALHHLDAAGELVEVLSPR
ncbi:MAG: hypothetical protein QOE72_2796 [Chloroflexota bacterium]|nr:hypothetical protein [Chloroflexota bacterium]